MWQRETGQQVNGVIAIDPVTLGYLLKATGPVQLATGDTLTSDNAVKLLLSEAYARYSDPKVQDAFFASAASAVFEKVSSGGFDAKQFVAALTQSAGRGTAPALERRRVRRTAHRRDGRRRHAADR